MLPASQPRKRGRPLALNDIKKREVCALVTAGCGIEGAARHVGCAASTIRREAKRDPQFNDELRRALLTAEVSMLSLLRGHAQKSWRAGAWLLERLNPQRFGRQDVRYVKPEALDGFTQLVGEVLKQETGDLELCQRIMRQLQQVAEEAHRLAWQEHHEPCPKRRRGEKSHAAEALREARAGRRKRPLTDQRYAPANPADPNPNV